MSGLLVNTNNVYAIVGGFMAASYMENSTQARAARFYDRVAGRK